MTGRLMTIAEASAYLSIPKATLYTWVCLKKIAYVKLGRSLRFDKEAMDAWVNEKTIGPRPS